MSSDTAREATDAFRRHDFHSAFAGLQQLLSSKDPPDHRVLHNLAVLEFYSQNTEFGIPFRNPERDLPHSTTAKPSCDEMAELVSVLGQLRLLACKPTHAIELSLDRIPLTRSHASVDSLESLSQRHSRQPSTASIPSPVDLLAERDPLSAHFDTSDHDADTDADDDHLTQLPALTPLLQDQGYLLYNQACVLYRLGRYAQSYRLLDSLHQVIPVLDSDISAHIRTLAIRVLLKLGMKTEALGQLRAYAGWDSRVHGLLLSGSGAPSSPLPIEDHRRLDDGLALESGSAPAPESRYGLASASTPASAPASSDQLTDPSAPLSALSAQLAFLELQAQVYLTGDASQADEAIDRLTQFADSQQLETDTTDGSSAVPSNVLQRHSELVHRAHVSGLLLRAQLEYRHNNHRASRELLVRARENGYGSPAELRVFYNNLGCLSFKSSQYALASLMFSKALHENQQCAALQRARLATRYRPSPGPAVDDREEWEIQFDEEQERERREQTGQESSTMSDPMSSSVQTLETASLTQDLTVPLTPTDDPPNPEPVSEDLWHSCHHERLEIVYNLGIQRLFANEPLKARQCFEVVVSTLEATRKPTAPDEAGPSVDPEASASNGDEGWVDLRLASAWYRLGECIIHIHARKKPHVEREISLGSFKIRRMIPKGSRAPWSHQDPKLSLPYASYCFQKAVSHLPSYGSIVRSMGEGPVDSGRERRSSLQDVRTLWIVVLTSACYALLELEDYAGVLRIAEQIATTGREDAILARNSSHLDPEDVESASAHFEFLRIIRSISRLYACQAHAMQLDLKQAFAVLAALESDLDRVAAATTTTTTATSTTPGNTLRTPSLSDLLKVTRECLDCYRSLLERLSDTSGRLASDPIQVQPTTPAGPTGTARTSERAKYVAELRQTLARLKSISIPEAIQLRKWIVLSIGQF
ncbi:uncharacterized protein BJ171DRAFT_567893 [Polychytrium aggregatum]|uniref:uncharacterized protein n=1 Tax=Polychytrium aggregatum TaxID=110093 RepID=UPI0022FEF713|nr:uncharacterized protein BJ171DRAFT_567893 [Polychytrium aggregatum]KAI9204867.1 hypothetical protein BJ171DRAFT_567893 [Polychytrium aggregatum]